MDCKDYRDETNNLYEKHPEHKTRTNAQTYVHKYTCAKILKYQQAMGIKIWNCTDKYAYVIVYIV